MKRKRPMDVDAYDLVSAEEFCGGKRRYAQLAAIQRMAKGERSKARWWARYSRYLHSQKWRSFKARIISKRGAMCERCGASGHDRKLHLHHLTYERMGFEAESDVKLKRARARADVAESNWLEYGGFYEEIRRSRSRIAFLRASREVGRSCHSSPRPSILIQRMSAARVTAYMA